MDSDASHLGYFDFRCLRRLPVVMATPLLAARTKVETISLWVGAFALRQGRHVTNVGSIRLVDLPVFLDDKFLRLSSINPLRWVGGGYFFPDNLNAFI